MSCRVSLATAVIAAACLAMPPGAACAQSPVADPSQAAAAAAPPSNAAASDSAPAGPAAAPAQPAADAAPAPAGPLVTYVKHTKPPFMADTTIAAAELGMVGAIVSISSGHEIVTANGIEDPATEIAHSVALAYAAAQGGHVADAPLADDQMPANTKPDAIGRYAGGARYVVNVSPVDLRIIYFVTDPLRRDVTLMTVAAIIDASTGKVVARAHCFITQSKQCERFTHDQLLADQAAALKAVIVRKGQACVDKLETGLKIAPTPVSAPSS